MSPAQIAYFLGSPYNKVADIKMLYFFQDISPLALTVMIALFVLSFLIPYFWCRYLCPYGALLGILSWFSPLKVRRDTDHCIECGQCAAVCPSFLDVDQRQTVTSPECTGCLECVHHCPVGPALEVRPPGRWRRVVRPAVFAAALVLLFYGGIGVAKWSGYWRTEISAEEFLQRVQEIDDPKYYHARGQVPDYGRATEVTAAAVSRCRVFLDQRRVSVNPSSSYPVSIELAHQYTGPCHRVGESTCT